MINFQKFTKGSASLRVFIIKSLNTNLYNLTDNINEYHPEIIGHLCNQLVA